MTSWSAVTTETLLGADKQGRAFVSTNVMVAMPGNLTKIPSHPKGACRSLHSFSIVFAASELPPRWARQR